MVFFLELVKEVLAEGGWRVLAFLVRCATSSPYVVRSTHPVSPAPDRSRWVRTAGSAARAGRSG